jgi:hypothetical protein
VSTRAAIAGVVLLLSSRAAGAMTAEACPQPDDPATGPLPGGTGPADFGAVPEACGVTDAALRLRAAALIASTMPDYYGRIIGTATLRARYQFGERSLLSFAADAFNYRYINNGGLVSHGASAGPATLGLHRTFAAGADTATALYARLLLPFDSLRQSGVETGLELGGALRVRAGSRWVLGGGLALAAPLDVTGGQAHLRLEPGALAEAWLRLGRSTALCGGMDVRVAAAPSFELITAIPRLGARFVLPRRLWTAVLVELPVAGRDRTDVIAGLFVGYVPH